MIKVCELEKLYKDESGVVAALDKVSFSLPNKGMVFVVGKSGCGKTTLLNILGGLDSFTSGEIFIGDKKLSDFSTTELDNYRNTTVGFVFQDFCLIDKMSVEENIRLSLKFQNNKENISIDDLLIKVGLEGLKNRKPTQLSAGQKQRVAIARAIVKKPNIILADEPTGNVDEKTSHQILSLLKEISKDRLVVIISHNNEEANIYADRILSMSDGKIISDKTLNHKAIENVKIDKNQAILQSSGKINDEELKQLNQMINQSNGDYLISQAEEKFVDTNYEAKGKKIKIKDTKMSTKSKINYSGFFFKKKLLFNVFMILLITFVTSIFTIVQEIGYCDFNNEFTRMLLESNYTDMTLFEASNNGKAFVEIDKTSVDELSNEYNVEIDYCHLVNIPFLDEKESEILEKTNMSSSKIIDGMVIESNGVRTTSIGKLNKLFNDFTILQGSINVFSTGVIITDYLADCIIALNNKYRSYQDIVDGGRIANYLDVDAIIKTDVYEKYDKQFSDFNRYKNDDEFINSLLTTYSYCYSLNNNFLTDYINESYSLKLGRSTSLHTIVTSMPNSTTTISNALIEFDESLKENQILMSFEKYNSIFSTSINKDNYLTSFPTASKFVNITLVDGNYDIYFNKQFIITGLFENDINSNISFKYSYDNYFDIVENEIFTYGIVFQTRNNSNANFYDFFSNHSWTIKISELNYMYSTVEMYSVFSDVFKYVSILLLIAIFLIIVLNANTLIRQNVYEIGLMKAFGAKTKELVFIFATQMIISCLCVCGLLYFMSLGVVSFSNNLIIKGILAYLNSSTVSKLSFNALIFNNTYFFINIAVITISTIISVIIPILSIRNIQPLKIIKTRN